MLWLSCPPSFSARCLCAHCQIVARHGTLCRPARDPSPRKQCPSSCSQATSQPSVPQQKQKQPSRSAAQRAHRGDGFQRRNLRRLRLFPPQLTTVPRVFCRDPRSWRLRLPAARNRPQVRARTLSPSNPIALHISRQHRRDTVHFPLRKSQADS